jgi:hypothetical protein
LIHDLVDLKLILSKSSPWFIDFLKNIIKIISF